MNLAFDATVAAAYKAGPQVARRLTEDWFERSMYCVACASPRLRRLPNNTEVSDFACLGCNAEFELKSGKARFPRTIPDGSYASMTRRLRAGTAPHLALLNYAQASVVNLVLIPGPLLTHELIVERKPLSPTARRPGWVGCKIRIGEVPVTGRQTIVEDGVALPPSAVTASWRRISAIADDRLAARTWMVDVLRCIERLQSPEFSLGDAYGFEAELTRRHPGNHNVRPKIRQQLQRLRDAGWLVFLGDGRYRLRSNAG